VSNVRNLRHQALTVNCPEVTHTHITETFAQMILDDVLVTFIC
jgi:hypothetical protein